MLAGARVYQLHANYAARGPVVRLDVYLYGWNTGGAWGGGSGSLMILAGVLVHRAARPQRQSVFLVVVAGRYLVCRFN